MPSELVKISQLPSASELTAGTVIPIVQDGETKKILAELLQGTPGIQGIQGEVGLQGIKGDTGEKGDTGLQGIQDISNCIVYAIALGG
jgi:uncharacterized protein CbrC (UPF0167 family)